jgi:hypothetical protein
VKYREYGSHAARTRYSGATNLQMEAFGVAGRWSLVERHGRDVNYWTLFSIVNAATCGRELQLNEGGPPPSPGPDSA